MSKKVYVVEGQTGEYSDHREWPVKAFLSEERAKKFVIDVTKEYHRLRQKYGERFGSWDIELGDGNLLDPDMQTDYTGTTYSYYSVDLDEDA